MKCELESNLKYTIEAPSNCCPAPSGMFSTGGCSFQCHTLNFIIIIISAVHATAGRWPPQLTPCTSILSHSHPLTATNSLDVVSPSPFMSPSYSFSFSGCSFSCYLGPPGVVHSGYMSCPLSSHAPHSLYYIFHPSFTSYYFIPNLVSLRDV